MRKEKRTERSKVVDNIKRGGNIKEVRKMPGKGSIVDAIANGLNAVRQRLSVPTDMLLYVCGTYAKLYINILTQVSVASQLQQ